MNERPVPGEELSYGELHDRTTALARGVAVPFNARFRHRELAFVIAHSDIEVLITTDLADEHTDFTALLAHEALVRSWSAYADLVGFEPDQSMWTPCPFFHVGGIGVTVSALVRGATMMSMNWFEPKVALAMSATKIQKFRLRELLV